MSRDFPSRARLDTLLLVVASLGAAASLVWLALSSWRHRFFCDDAYISFRYARNLIEGHGLVFNPGEWVEGYTNFLWVLQVAALWRLGLDPEISAAGMSLAATAGTVALTAWWARDGRSLVWALALIVLATERSFAVWATGGLETRQFTLLVLAGVILGERPGLRAATGMSLCLGLAALTRPEALLVFGIVAGCRLADLLRTRASEGVRERLAPELLASALPFAALVGSHLALRLWLYGAWVPNTYVAKHVAPWPEMGWRYLSTGALEAGLYLLLPLAAVGLGARAWSMGRLSPLAGLLAILAEAAFLVRIGGDHFEWRPLDWWWPIMSVGAAQGMVLLAGRLAPLLLLGVLLYGRSLELAHDQVVDRLVARGVNPGPVVLTPRNAGWLWKIPLMPAVVERHNRQMSVLLEHWAAVRHHKHRSFVEKELAFYEPYLAVRHQLDLPDDAVAVRFSVGVAPFYLPDLVVVDLLGLNDATIARTPVPADASRKIGHDRRPPPGYLQQRGVKLEVGPAARSVQQALSLNTYAVPIGSGELLFTFHPFDAEAERWAQQAFAGRGLLWREHHALAERNTLVLGEQRWRGERLLGTFEDGLDGWQGSGRAFQVTQTPDRVATRVAAQSMVGRGYVTSQRGPGGRGATGTLRSPEVTIEGDELLSLLMAGGREQVGVRVLVDGVAEVTWHGEDDAWLRYRWLSLAPWAGRTLQIELFDESAAPAGYLMVDHVALLVPDEM